MNQGGLQSFIVEIPGKQLLTGEYAVLWGGPSISVAVDAFMKIAFTPIDSIQSEQENKKNQTVVLCEIHSDIWSEPLYYQPGMTAAPQTALVIHLLNNYFAKIIDELQENSHVLLADFFNWKITISSGWQISDGLGSSSALRLGLLKGLNYIAKQNNVSELWSDEEVAKQAYLDQKKQQGFASGYDIMTQALGGVLLFRQDELCWPLENNCFTEYKDWLQNYFHIYVGGKGAPTEKVGGSTLQWLSEHDKKSELSQLMEVLKEEILAAALKSKNDSPFSQLFWSTCRDLRHLFAETSYFPQQIFSGLEEIDGFDCIWTCKTSGAGGEDALLLIGKKSDLFEADRFLRSQGWYSSERKITENGITLRKMREKELKELSHGN